MGIGEVVEVAKLPWTIFLKRGTADTEIKTSAKNPELSKAPSFRPEGQNIALYALPPSRDSTFLIFAFPGHSTLLKKKESGEEPGLNNWRLDLNPADVAVSHRYYTHTHSRPATLGGDKRNLPLEVLAFSSTHVSDRQGSTVRGRLHGSHSVHSPAPGSAGRSRTQPLLGTDTACTRPRSTSPLAAEKNISNTKTDHAEPGAKETLNKTRRGKLWCKR